MKLTKIKLAMFGAVALGLAYAGPASAQTENMGATLTTSSAITSNFVNNIDFGEYFINFGTDTPILRASAVYAGPAAVTQVGTVTDSQIVQITAPATQGEITVQTPAPSTLTMTLDNFTDFGDAALSLTSVRYSTATEAVTAISTAAMPTAGNTVTVLASATDERVVFGGDLTITGTPADAAHTADFDVIFSY